MEELVNPQQVKDRLRQAYPEGDVDVTDMTGTEDHYSVFVRSKKFVGMSRIQVHKDVMKAFDVELKSGEVHALTIKTETKE